MTDDRGQVAYRFMAAALSIFLIVCFWMAHLESRDSQADVDAQLAELWDSSSGALGEVRGSVIDGCAREHASVHCLHALRGAVLFYALRVGGEYGCGRARRALELYSGSDAADLAERVKDRCAAR